VVAMLVILGCVGRLHASALSLSCKNKSGPPQVGVDYSVTCTASGGTPPYQFQGIDGDNTAWLVESGSTATTITLSGTPFSTGSYIFYVTVNDKTTEQEVTISGNVTLAMANFAITSPSSLSAGKVGASYGPVQFTASGGSGGNTWSAGGLPGGLFMTGSGTLHGTPEAGTQGTYSVGVTVRDSKNDSVSKVLSLTINPSSSGGGGGGSSNLSVTPSVSGSTTTTSASQIVMLPVIVTNSGSATTFTASIVGPPQFSISPTTGSIGGPGSTATLTVTFDGTGQPPGIYTATYTVVANGPTTVPGSSIKGETRGLRTEIPAALGGMNMGTATVALDGTLNLSTLVLNFNLAGPPPFAPQQVSVNEAKGFAMPVSASYSGDMRPIVTVTPPSGVTPEGVNVAVGLGTLLPGATANGFLNLSCMSAQPCTISPISVPITIKYASTTQTTLLANPTTLAFTYQPNQAQPNQQPVMVSSSGSALPFTFQSNVAWLTISGNSTTTPATLNIGLDTTKLPGIGQFPGVVQLNSSAGSATITVSLTVSQSPNAPSINANGIVNNASFATGSEPLAPGSIVAIFGTNLTDGSSCLEPTCGPAFQSGRLNTTLSGAQVTVNGTPAPIFYASPLQIGIQIPAELTTETASVVVSAGGAASLTQQIDLVYASPGIFTTTANGKGVGAVTHADGSAVNSQHPAVPNEVVILYATGFGQVQPDVPTGALPLAGGSMASAPVTVSVDGVSVVPEFAGLSGCCVGENQVNFRIPSGTRSGNDIPVALTVGAQQSNQVTISVQGN
jgi:uncharacterized protein (TIGR03437 family)